MTFRTIQAARTYLLNNGYRFIGYGALTQAEMYRAGAQTVAIRRNGRGGGVVVR